ncbi:MAG TPA: glycosyltransferase family 39 protein [Thermoanaerobaculia bacterium]|jgi:4-amino-4-deoxy-L-arabinose transferase-like glycosyltransferase
MIRLAGFAAGHLLRLLVFAAAAWGAGGAALRRVSTPLGFASRLERAALSTVFGFGLLSTVFFGLACLRLLRAPAVAIVLAAGVLLVWRERRAAHEAIRGAGPKALAALALLTPLFYASLFPPTDPDATMYHLPAARAFAVSGAIPALPDLRYPVFPQLAELLDAAALLVGDDVLVALLNLLWCVLVAALLVAWGKRLRDPRAGVWGAGLWIGSPLVLLLARSGLVEPAASGFLTASLLAMEGARVSGGLAWLAVSGALAGWAAGTKYTGLYFAAALFAVALIVGRPGARARGAVLFALGALAAAGPWYLRNLILAGNPVWPFLGKIFGYRFWGPADVASATWSLSHEGGSHRLAALLTLPWRLAVFRLPGSLGLFPGLFALFPVGVVWGLRSRSLRWVTLVSLGFLLFWFATTQQIRFLVPGLPAIALLTAGAVSRFADRFLPMRRPAATAALTAAALVVFAALLTRDTVRRLVPRGLPPMDENARAAYFTSRMPSYPLYRMLNGRHGAAYTIYAFHDEPMKYFCEGRHLGDWFGPASYGSMRLSSGRDLLESLGRFRADYLLVNESSFPARLPRDGVFEAHFEEIYRNGAIRAFRIR